MGTPETSGGDDLTRAGVSCAIRCSFWCSFPLAVGSLAAGVLVLSLFEWAVIPVAAAMVVFLIGLLIMGLRLFAYVLEVEPQYWETPRPPDHCCQHCGYDLTGNVSGVCPECGTRTLNDRA